MSEEQEMYVIKEEKEQTLILDWVAYFIPHYLNALESVNYAVDTTS